MIQPVKDFGRARADKRAEGVAPATAAERKLDQGLLQSVPAGEMRSPRRALRRRAWDWLRCAPARDPLPAFIGPVERPPAPDDPNDEAPRIGICCSGGGIRSAAFTLGALQTLQAQGVLGKARYLAAVSGGAYTAAGFAMVARTPRDATDVDDSDPELVTPRAPAFHRGSPEEQYLRNRSTYLAPTGLDKFRVALRMLLGLFWNLIFIEAIIFPIAIACAWLYWHGFRDLSMEPPDVDMRPAALWVPIGVGIVSLVLMVVTLVLPLTNSSRHRAVEGWAVRFAIAALALAFLGIAGPYILRELLIHGASSATPSGTAAKPVGFAGFTGLLTIAAGLFAQFGRFRASAERVAATAEDTLLLRHRAANLGRTAIAYGAAAIAVPLLGLLGFLVPIAWALAAASTTEFNPTPVWIAVASLSGFALAWTFADLTTWSLHPLYKQRLATAFALKRVKGSGPQGETRGRAMARDHDNLPTIRRADVSTDDSPFPTLVVCAAATISDPGATPPGRRVTSFTFSPGAIGGPLVGAVTPADYERGMGPERARTDAGLLTAVAVSGAALIPTLGKDTRWPLRALMALANVRLGVWMRNPRHLKDAGVYPRPRPQHLLFEILGHSPVDGKYLYVTDGGRYENLGLVELLRRGCTEIYCFDACGAKPDEALGDAVALARSELEVKIDIDSSELTPDESTGLAVSDTALGRIEYRDAMEHAAPLAGRIVYARTVLTKDAPFDVKAYHDVDPKFPQHPGTDQLYTDQKFEAYRALGARAATSALATMTADAMGLTPQTDVPAGAERPAADTATTNGDGAAAASPSATPPAT